jgi:hypothetical protein
MKIVLEIMGLVSVMVEDDDVTPYASMAEGTAAALNLLDEAIVRESRTLQHKQQLRNGK